MSTVFMVFAVLGGTVLICQFVMTILGLGDHGIDTDFDVVDDIPDDVSVEMEDGDTSGLGEGTSWLFAVISFRTVVAAATFFGLGGLWAQSLGWPSLASLLTALLLGTTAMFSVHWVMKTFYRLGADGTVQIQRAVGQPGKVYIPIPAGEARPGKIQLNVQNRLIEYDAITANGEALPTGARVVVVRVLGKSTLVVEPVLETAGTVKN